MNFIQKLVTYIRANIQEPRVFEKTTLLGQALTVHRGTIHAKPDYDDAWLLALALHSEIVIDVGSNIGQASMLILLSETVKRILLIDSNPKALAIAAENLILNRLSMKASFIFAFASATTDEHIKFWTIGSGAAGSMFETHAKTASSIESSFTVPTVTIDALCSYYHIIPDLVKVDVEGAEYDVLVGCEDCASHQKTRFHVEMHSNDELSMSENAIHILGWCEKNEYQAWYLKEGSKLLSARQIEHRGRCHLLLQPKQWVYPHWLTSIKQGSPLEIVRTNVSNL